MTQGQRDPESMRVVGHGLSYAFNNLPGIATMRRFTFLLVLAFPLIGQTEITRSPEIPAKKLSIEDQYTTDLRAKAEKGDAESQWIVRASSPSSIAFTVVPSMVFPA
jgi:hypothetical protein